jgi:hypothetical protein
MVIHWFFLLGTAGGGYGCGKNNTASPVSSVAYAAEYCWYSRQWKETLTGKPASPSSAMVSVTSSLLAAVVTSLQPSRFHLPYPFNAQLQAAVEMIVLFQIIGVICEVEQPLHVPHIYGKG